MTEMRLTNAGGKSDLKQHILPGILLRFQIVCVYVCGWKVVSSGGRVAFHVSVCF